MKEKKKNMAGSPSCTSSHYTFTVPTCRRGSKTPKRKIAPVVRKCAVFTLRARRHVGTRQVSHVIRVVAAGRAWRNGYLDDEVVTLFYRLILRLWKEREHLVQMRVDEEKNSVTRVYIHKSRSRIFVQPIPHTRRCTFIPLICARAPQKGNDAFCSGEEPSACAVIENILYPWEIHAVTYIGIFISKAHAFAKSFVRRIGGGITSYSNTPARVCTSSLPRDFVTRSRRTMIQTAQPRESRVGPVFVGRDPRYRYIRVELH